MFWRAAYQWKLKRWYHNPYRWLLCRLWHRKFRAQFGNDYEPLPGPEIWRCDKCHRLWRERGSYTVENDHRGIQFIIFDLEKFEKSHGPLVGTLRGQDWWLPSRHKKWVQEYESHMTLEEAKASEGDKEDARTSDGTAKTD